MNKLLFSYYTHHCNKFQLWDSLVEMDQSRVVQQRSTSLQGNPPQLMLFALHTISTLRNPTSSAFINILENQPCTKSYLIGDILLTKLPTRQRKVFFQNSKLLNLLTKRYYLIQMHITMFVQSATVHLLSDHFNFTSC